MSGLGELRASGERRRRRVVWLEGVETGGRGSGARARSCSAYSKTKKKEPRREPATTRRRLTMLSWRLGLESGGGEGETDGKAARSAGSWG